MDGPRHKQTRWNRARNAVKQIEVGDQIVVSLRQNRVARIGEVTRLSVEDAEWDALVPESKTLPFGEQGRRVHVRWDFSVGPEDRGQVVLLPAGCRFSSGEVRPSISVIRSMRIRTLVRHMNDPKNWVSLLASFARESALSDYIANFPHRLEDGLRPYPSKDVREKVFDDRSRADVLLLDRDGTPVIVECKQGAPTTAHVSQLVHYLQKLRKETGIEPRGMLVHGGSRKLHPDVLRAARKQSVEVIQYKLGVDFASCW